MSLELYHFPQSPPCIMVRLLAKQLELEVEEKEVDVQKGEQLKEEFLSINPQHTIPTLVDDGFVVTESRAVLMYLVNKYGADDEAVASLYPSDVKERAVIDMRMCYELSTLYARFSDLYFPVMCKKSGLNPEKMERLTDALGHVNNFVNDGGFVAGSNLTIADFSVAVLLSVLEASGFDLSPFPEISPYLKKCAEVMTGWEEIALPGTGKFGEFIKQCLSEVAAELPEGGMPETIYFQ